MAQRRFSHNNIIKLLILTALFLIIIRPIYSLSYNERMNVTTINSCYDKYKVTVRGEQKLTPKEYMVIDCNYKNEYWECKCNNPSTVYIKNVGKTPNVYDVIIEYYLEPKLSPGEESEIIEGGLSQEEIYNDNNKRTQTFSNIKFGDVPSKKVSTKLPEFKDKLTIIPAIGIIVILLGGMIYFGYKMIFVEGQNDNIKLTSKRNEIKRVGEQRITEEDVDNYLGK